LLKRLFLILYILLILKFLSYSSCGENSIQKTKENTPIETFDFIEYNKRVNNDPNNGRFYTKEDGTYVEEIVVGNKKRTVRWETPPKPSFFKFYKEFYPNGNIKSIEILFGKFTKIGISSYFNREGKIIKEIDENVKFGKIKPKDILKFLENKNRINIETGEGIFDKENKETFKIVYNEEKNIWFVTIIKGRYYTESEMLEIMKNSRGDPNIWRPFNYEIDGETGELISIEE